MSTKKKLIKEPTQNKTKKDKEKESICEEVSSEEQTDVIEKFPELKELPPKERKAVVQKISMNYSGPIPHYSDFEGYEKVLPGAADRILQMAESQSEHRQHLERMVVYTGVENSKRGQWFGFIIAVIAIIGGFFLIYCDKDALGITSILGAIGSLVVVFALGNSSEKKERKEKK